MTHSAEDVFIEGLLKKEAELTLPMVAAPEEVIPPTQPPVPKSLTYRSVFSHPDAHPLALDVTLLKHFELEWLSWLSDTLFLEIERTFSTSIAEVNKLKILAVQTLHVIDTCWEEWEIFEKHIWALNGMVPRVDSIQPPDLTMLFSGVSIINSIRKETFGEEVARYCAAVFLYENVHYAPEPLSFCQDFISQPMFTCKDCGQKGSTLPPFEGMCWSCGRHFQSEHPFKFEPDPEVVKKGGAKNLDYYVTYDCNPVKKRFDELNALPADKLKAAIKENSDDIQSAKLITAVDFVKYKSQQLAEQLSSLKTWLGA